MAEDRFQGSSFQTASGSERASKRDELEQQPSSNGVKTEKNFYLPIEASSELLRPEGQVQVHLEATQLGFKTQQKKEPIDANTDTDTDTDTNTYTEALITWQDEVKQEQDLSESIINNMNDINIIKKQMLVLSKPAKRDEA